MIEKKKIIIKIDIFLKNNNNTNLNKQMVILKNILNKYLHRYYEDDIF